MASASNRENLEVLYEDNHIIAVAKRSSDIVQGDKTGDTPLRDVVMEWIRVKYNKPGNVFVGVVHRLDRPVSGIVLFAKTSKALPRLNRMFQDKQVHKTYVAAVVNAPPAVSGTLENSLMRDREKNKSKVVSPKHKTAKRAVLEYRLLGKSENYHLLEINPHTGRHHQIRVQLSAMGCAIKGDVKYGAPRTNPDASIHLHAYKLEFTHPVSGIELSIVAPLPDDPVWNAFRPILQANPL